MSNCQYWRVESILRKMIMQVGLRSGELLLFLILLLCKIVSNSQIVV